MEDIFALNETFQRLISLSASIEPPTVILANQGRDTEGFGLGLYATYNPVPIRAYGQATIKRKAVVPVEPVAPSLGEDWTDFEETVCSSIEVMLSVNFLNAGAAQAAMMLQNANFRAPVSEFLFRHNMAWRYASNPRNLTGLFQAGIQPRWQTDIQLFIEHTVSYSVLRAAGVEIIPTDRS